VALIAIPTALAGPVEFGTEELRQAIAARKLSERIMPRIIEVSAGSRPDSFQITPTRISGGDLRGLMYGLLEAASQVRDKGRLTSVSAEPFVALRGVRIVLRNDEWEKRSFHDAQFWSRFLCSLPRWRINRLQLVFGAHEQWTPVYSRLLSLPLFPVEDPQGVTPFERGRNMDALRMIAQTATGCGVDFAIGIHHHAVSGIPAERHAAYLRSAFESLLTAIPSLRSAQIVGPSELLREVYLPAIREAGRLVTFEILEPDAVEELRKQAREQGVALRVVQPLPPGAFLPALTQLQAGREPVLRSIAASQFADPAFALLAARGVALGAGGIEVEALRDFHQPESELFYESWGRLSFDPTYAVAIATPARTAASAAGRAETAFGWSSTVAPSLAAVQLLHSSALDVERAIEAFPKDDPLRNQCDTVARRNRYAARAMWANVMYAHYEKTKHQSALLGARNELRGAIRIGETLHVVTDDLRARLSAIDQALAAMPPEEGSSALPWTAPVRKPSLTHRPFLMALNNKPLVVPVFLAQPAAVSRIRLRYRMLSFAGEFKSLEASSRSASFTIPVSDLRIEGTLLYYFELEGPAGTWYDPDPRSSLPVYSTAIKNPPPLKEERALMAQTTVSYSVR